jgi:hypothetical protein
MSAVDVEQDWLSLAEYSSEYGVSVSTLRRRIKGNKIKYKLVHGKYFLPRQELPPQNSQTFTPVPNTKAPESLGSEPEANSFHSAKALLDELKKAYRESLQSKEDQIIHLKQQITDLKTLVMYLERENEKLSSQRDAN